MLWRASVKIKKKWESAFSPKGNKLKEKPK